MRNKKIVACLRIHQYRNIKIEEGVQCRDRKLKRNKMMDRGRNMSEGEIPPAVLKVNTNAPWPRSKYWCPPILLFISPSSLFLIPSLTHSLLLRSHWVFLLSSPPSNLFLCSSLHSSPRALLILLLLPVTSPFLPVKSFCFLFLLSWVV